MTRVPYVDFSRLHNNIKHELHDALERVLIHGEFILGQEVAEFEAEIATYLGVKHAIGVGNGTDALYLSLKALGIGSGDEVITPPNSYLASTSSVILAGATPVFVDVDKSMNIDPKLIRSKITDRTKAIIVVHLTGNPANMDEIQKVAAEFNLNIVEDAAQSIGAEYKGRKVGSIGALGCFSMHPLKNLGALGDAGLVTTNNDEYAKFLKLARNHGHITRDTCAFWSHNMRLDALQAAFLRVKLKELDNVILIRRMHAKKYIDRLCSIIELPVETEDSKSVYHTFIIRVDDRDELADYLIANGVETKIHYPIPIHRQKAAIKLASENEIFTQVDAQAKRILSLPIAEYLSEYEIDRVINLINRYYE